MKGVLLKYLKNTQLSDAKNEALLEVVFSMLHLSEGDKKDIKQAREKISPLINENPKSNWTSPGRSDIKKWSFLGVFSRNKE